MSRVITLDQLNAYRDLAVTLLDYACNGSHGRPELDPVYVAITESRDGPTPKARSRYSSCADLAHWLYARLGIAYDVPWLNREEESPDPGDWRSGVNLNWLVPPAIGRCTSASHGLVILTDGPLGARVDADIRAGDVIVVNNRFGGHVMCVTGHDPASHIVYTAEYGQPGGALKSHYYDWGVREGRISGNPVISHVRLSDVLSDCEFGTPRIDCLDTWQAPEALAALKARIGGA